MPPAASAKAMLRNRDDTTSALSKIAATPRPTTNSWLSNAATGTSPDDTAFPECRVKNAMSGASPQGHGDNPTRRQRRRFKNLGASPARPPRACLAPSDGPIDEAEDDAASGGNMRRTGARRRIVDGFGSAIAAVKIACQQQRRADGGVEKRRAPGEAFGDADENQQRHEKNAAGIAGSKYHRNPEAGALADVAGEAMPLRSKQRHGHDDAGSPGRGDEREKDDDHAAEKRHGS